MKNLEDIINSRREEFDAHEPSENHMEKFLNMLPVKENNTKLYLIRIAAVILAAAFLSAATWVYLGMQNKGDNMNAFSNEIKETIYYYNSLNYEMENEIMAMPIEYKNEKNMIQKDLNSYDEQYQQLLEDARKYPNDERIINAIIEYHRSKSEMLEHILYQLKQRNV